MEEKIREEVSFHETDLGVLHFEVEKTGNFEIFVWCGSQRSWQP